MVEYVCYFYGGKHVGLEQTPFRCPSCSRVLFKHNSTRIMISNAYGAGTTEILAGSKDADNNPIPINLKCHGCKSLYRIFFM